MTAPGPEHFYPLPVRKPGRVWRPEPWSMFIGMWLTVGALLLGYGCAHAAELPPPTWEIFVYLSGRDLREDKPTNRPLYDAEHRKTFNSFSECRDEILFVKIRQAGLRLRCDRTDR